MLSSFQKNCYGLLQNRGLQRSVQCSESWASHTTELEIEHTVAALLYPSESATGPAANHFSDDGLDVSFSWKMWIRSLFVSHPVARHLLRSEGGLWRCLSHPFLTHRCDFGISFQTSRTLSCDEFLTSCPISNCAKPNVCVDDGRALFFPLCVGMYMRSRLTGSAHRNRQCIRWSPFTDCQ
nr:unnamed protein product [Haemonchus contortus]